MSDFGEQVERAAAPLPKVWRLMVWDVPEGLNALLSRHRFKPTKKNPRNWWRIFDPAQDREAAEQIRAELLDAGLKGSWSKVTASVRQMAAHASPRPTTKLFPKRFPKHTPYVSREGFGGALNARPIAGSWRRKTRHK